MRICVSWSFSKWQTMQNWISCMHQRRKYTHCHQFTLKISPKRWWLLQVFWFSVIFDFFCSVSSICCTRTNQITIFMQNNHKTLVQYKTLWFYDLYSRANLGKIFVLDLLCVCFGFDDNVIIIIKKSILLYYLLRVFLRFLLRFTYDFDDYSHSLFSRYSRCYVKNRFGRQLGRYFFLIATTTKNTQKTQRT